MAEERANGNGTLVTLRIFIDCETTAQIGAIMSVCEQVGLTPKLVPHTMRLGKSGPRRSKYGLLALGDATKGGGKYDRQFKRAKEILKLADGGTIQRIDLVAMIAKTFRVENKMAGYWVKNWIDAGSLKDA